MNCAIYLNIVLGWFIHDHLFTLFCDLAIWKLLAQGLQWIPCQLKQVQSTNASGGFGLDPSRGSRVFC